jgi:hypothetical protein
VLIAGQPISWQSVQAPSEFAADAKVLVPAPDPSDSSRQYLGSINQPPAGDHASRSTSWSLFSLTPPLSRQTYEDGRGQSSPRLLEKTCLRRQRSWPSGNAGRAAVEFHDIANAQLTAAPGLRLAVH